MTYAIFKDKVKIQLTPTRGIDSSLTEDGKHVIPIEAWREVAHLVSGIEPIGTIENPKFPESEGGMV